ncbi:Signal transduction histidine kinase [Blastococcus aurantiacus]|uniref:Circadian input-output histidine kinase CikA n=1 Tax=Blastococcus aurantiacus TaxID=1550231 RepID=A0A1G7Q8N9_9ACTN|nr:GAF domain-containing hybrid sensor histidine kinase/response regulator [Blastococcus aurantiacus]SDF94825.1 Signal transduction histidine kinase [Blastococcus aurantiacus]
MTAAPLLASGPSPDLLREYELPEGAPAEQVRAVTRVAATVCGVPHAVVNLLDECFQHQVGEIGFPGSRSDLSESMCALAMREPRLRHVPDASSEPAYAGNPWVDGRLGKVRLYATAPMRLLDGRVLGTLCVFAEEPGSLSPAQLGALEDLAAQAVALFEQGRLARELAAARDQALAATRAKTAFLAAASHEIRTPLNGVLGMLEALELERLTPRQGEFVSLARSSAESLLALLNDVLDLSKAETTAVTLAEREFRPADVAAEVVTALLPVARRKGIELAVRGSDDGLLLGDPVRLRQVIMNLVGNALKFTERGRVHVAVRIDHDPDATAARLRLSVSDTGAGMEADEIQRLFRPFVQGAQGARFGGTGLGLALSQQIVGLMGGRIDVVSRPGTGSLFTVVVDLPGATGDASAAVPADRPAPAAWTVPGPRAPSRRAVRVLVADDSEVNLRVAEALLQAEGAEVVTVEDGDEAVRTVAAEHFDLVLLDMQMPRMSGPDAARAIRALDGPRSRTRLLALTAATTEEDREACLAAGMQGVLLKPVRRAELRAVLDEATPA